MCRLVHAARGRVVHTKALDRRGWAELGSEGLRGATDVSGPVAELPGAEERTDHGHTGYAVRGKRFAWLLVDHHGDERLALCVKSAPGEQEALVSADPGRYFVPAYLGHHGWVGLMLDEGSRPDWPEVTAMVEQAWRFTAGKRAVAAYAR
ncbi:MAG: MmcQ/YjbR family DNA-binding protein [Actinomycetota bacterium]|nr:MmcQ/YjbR family DNA-binding protein [Actinomycetota bacterium]